VPSEAFLQDPSNLDVFQPDHLGGLDLKHGQPDEKDSKLIRHVGLLAGLWFLNLEESDIGDTDLEEVKKLPLLKYLNVNGTGISGAGLAKLPQLRQLKVISFRRCLGARDLLAALKGSDKLVELFLDEDPLTPSDFETISTLSNLQGLRVDSCGMTTAGLVSLTALSKLKIIEAGDYVFTPEAFEALKTMQKNGLEKVKFSDLGLSSSDMHKIHQIIPKAEFTHRYDGKAKEGNDLLGDQYGRDAKEGHNLLEDLKGTAKSVP
jgi:hypothetical protein